MKVRDSVFGSHAERLVYKALGSTWGKQLNLFASLPFASIIDIQDGNLTGRQEKYLHGTSVDFTLCEKETDRPLLSIEFDGLGHGFSRNGEYVEILPGKDPYRKLKLDLKLKIAGEVLYPFFVVSYDEGYPFRDLGLTIVDGIIGHVLTYHNYLPKALEERAPELKEQSPEDFQRMKKAYERFAGREYTYQHYVQDWVTGVEVEVEMEWSPIARKIAELEGQLLKLAGTNVRRGWAEESLEEPAAPNPGWPPTIDGIEKRVHALANARRVGCRYTLDTILGKVEKVVWVRNVTLPTKWFDVTPASVARDIAEVLALQEVCERASKSKESRSE